MEFDTSVRLRTVESFDIASPLPQEEFIHRVWDLAAAGARNVGDGGGGTLWIDHSRGLQTRYLVVDITDDEPGTYHVRISAGTRPSYLWDVLAAAAAIAFFWCLSRVFRPGPVTSWGYWLGISFAAGTGVVLAREYGKAFGREEADKLKKAICTL